MPRYRLLSVSVVSAIGWVAWVAWDSKTHLARFLTSKGQGVTSTEHSPDHACLSVGDHPILHDKRKEAHEALKKHDYGIQFTDSMPKPTLRAIRDGHYVIRQPGPKDKHHSRVSVWNDKDQIVLRDDDGHFMEPDYGTIYKTVKELRNGDYFAYTNAGWWEGHPGHFKHDVLPKIAYFRSTLPTTTKFVLPYIGSYAAMLGFLDQEFCDNRVEWIPGCFDCAESIVINGTLTVATKNHLNPVTQYHDFYNPLRTWVRSRLPYTAPKRTVIYYKRLSGPDVVRGQAKNGRILNLAQEEQVLQKIRLAMKRHKRDYELVVFDGTTQRPVPEGATGEQLLGEMMPARDQFELFRSAQTILGPHGTGLGANLLWTDPDPPNCESRVQVLEFMPGHDSYHVHPEDKFMSHYPYVRGLPLNHHAVFYLPNSTHRETFIDVDMVDEFLDDVWGEDKEGDPPLTMMPGPFKASSRPDLIGSPWWSILNLWSLQ